MALRLIILSVLCFAAPVYAQMSPVSRHSRIYAWEHIINLSGHDLGVVSVERTTDGLDPFDWETGAGGYSVIQHSSVGSSEVNFVGSAFGTPHSARGFGGAESSMTYVFDIANPATFRLEGTVAAFIQGVSRVSLTGPGVNLLADAVSGTPNPFLFEGNFISGRYTMSVMATADFGSTDAKLSVVPAPAPYLLIGASLLACRRRRP